jgi:excisionase family DNA binding protein
MNRTPAVFTVNDLAERWSVNHKTVRAMLDRGDLRHFRVGKMIKISEAAVAEFEGWNIEESGSEADGMSRGKGQTVSNGARFVPSIVTPPNNA